MKRKKAIRITEVAQEAGLSTTTVSYILNNTMPYAVQFTEETRKKVFDAATKLKYSPNVFAAGLRTSNRNLIGVYLGDSFESSPMQGLVRSPFGDYLTDLLYGINMAALEYDLYPIMRMDSASQQPPTLGVLEKFARVGIFSALLFQPGTEIIESLVKYPQDSSDSALNYLILFGSMFAEQTKSFIDVDNYGMGRLAATTLLQQGVTRVRLVGCDVAGVDLQSRIKGAQEVFQNASVVVEDSVFYFPNLNRFTDYYAVMQSLHQAFENCEADGVITLIGGYGPLLALALHRMNKKVPEQIRMVGIDANYWTEPSVPPIPSVHGVWREVGRQGMELLHSISLGNNQISLPVWVSPDMTFPALYQSRLGLMV